jgi:hypothetical protein
MVRSLFVQLVALNLAKVDVLVIGGKRMEPLIFLPLFSEICGENESFGAPLMLAITDLVRERGIVLVLSMLDEGYAST